MIFHGYFCVLLTLRTIQFTTSRLQQVFTTWCDIHFTSEHITKSSFPEHQSLFIVNQSMQYSSFVVYRQQKESYISCFVTLFQKGCRPSLSPHERCPLPQHADTELLPLSLCNPHLLGGVQASQYGCSFPANHARIQILCHEGKVAWYKQNIQKCMWSQHFWFTLIHIHSHTGNQTQSIFMVCNHKNGTLEMFNLRWNITL